MRGWKDQHDKPVAERHGEEGGKHFHGLGRGKRLFGQGDIRFVVLALLAEKASYGYELIKAIEGRLNGAYTPSPGLVYPTLTLLEEMGYASTATSQEGKTLYWITPDGEAFLKANKPMVDIIFSRMSLAAERHQRAENPQFVRAIENLKLTLKLKSGAGELTDGQIHAITDILDDAAREIEKC